MPLERPLSSACRPPSSTLLPYSVTYLQANYVVPCALTTLVVDAPSPPAQRRPPPAPLCGPSPSSKGAEEVSRRPGGGPCAMTVTETASATKITTDRTARRAVEPQCCVTLCWVPPCHAQPC
eukprot:350919-Chlamydomonas_euryale.AAC.1